MGPTDKLRKYLESALRRPVELTPRLDPLPLYLGTAYDCYAAELWDRLIVFAIARSERAAQDGKRMTADAEVLRKTLGADELVLVFDRVTAAQRKRLMRAALPFVVPGKQLYLPDLLVDLRERYDPETAGPTDPLAWATQLVLLRHLQKRDVEQHNFTELAGWSGYSNMTISNVARELGEAQAAERRQDGRERHLKFKGGARDLWELLLPRLRSPLKGMTALWDVGPLMPLLRAGYDALSMSTAIAAEPVATLAVYRRDLQRALRDKDVVRHDDPDLAEAWLQVWMYDPRKLSDGNVVDPLSLWLTLRDEPDERTQIALERLLDSVPW